MPTVSLDGSREKLALCASEAGSFPRVLSDSDWMVRRYNEDRATGPTQQRETR